VATVVVVTAKGREVISGRMIGASPTQVEPKNLGWGTGTQTVATTDVAPFIESSEARVAGTSSQVTTTTTNDTYQVSGTITSASNQTIAEVFLSDSATKPFSTTWVTAPTGTAGTTGTLTASYTPANGTYVQCEGEVMQVTAGTGTTSVTVTRAANGSAAATHANGTTVTLGNPPGTATANATMYAHVSFTGLALSTGDSLASTVQIKHS
jgi:hypothetical protein